jgi:D-lactate dehydrogenase
MASPQILFVDVDPEDHALITERFPGAELCGHLDDAALVQRAAEAQVLSVFIQTPLQKSLLEQLPKLRLVCTRSVGFDHIDREYCKERGILVCNVPDYGSHVIAEHVFALLLSTIRHVLEGNERVEGGHFDYHGLRGMALRGKTIGIVGTGKIGRRVAQIAHGFGMRIIAHDVCRNTDLEDLLGVRYQPLPSLLEHADIVTLHLPDIPETHHVINADAFSRMKDGVVLINTARGGLIDSAALLQALKSGKVRYALLDVLEHEQNFAENKELISHPGVVTTPHIAFYADDSMRNMYVDCFDSIDQWAAGKTPEHIVRPQPVVCDIPPTK